MSLIRLAPGLLLGMMTAVPGPLAVADDEVAVDVRSLPPAVMTTADEEFRYVE